MITLPKYRWWYLWVLLLAFDAIITGVYWSDLSRPLILLTGFTMGAIATMIQWRRICEQTIETRNGWRELYEEVASQRDQLQQELGATVFRALDNMNRVGE